MNKPKSNDLVNSKEKTTAMEKDKQIVYVEMDDRRIINRLDIQALIAVTIFIVPGWFYMNSVISSFTDAISKNERMAFILVHYILTAVIILCMAITYIKGKALIHPEKPEFTDTEKLYIGLLINGWIYALGLSIAIIVVASIIPGLSWGWEAFGGIVLLVCYMHFRMHFKLEETIIINVMLMILFPIFISVMTNVTKNIELGYIYDKETGNLTITVNPQSYDDQYLIKGLADPNLHDGEQYKVFKHSIYTNIANLNSDEIVVCTVSPASGDNFFIYGVAKVLGIKLPKDIPNNSITYNKIISINVE